MQGQFGVSFLFNKKIIIKNIQNIINGRIILAKCSFDNFDFIIINIYAPHVSDIKNITKIKNKYIFFQHLTSLINSYKNYNLILAGDLNAAFNKNIDYLYQGCKSILPGFTIDEINMLNKLYNDTQLINLYKFTGTYTFYSKRTKIKNIMFDHGKGLSIDYFMINQKFKKNISSIKFDILKQYYSMSDHLPLYIKINF
jgi:exonuclease III